MQQITLRDEDVQTRLKHLWDHFVGWGLKNPEKRDALRRLAVSEKVSQVKDHAEDETCASMASMIQADLSSGLLRVQPIEFLAGTIQALGDMVTEMIARDRAKAGMSTSTLAGTRFGVPFRHADFHSY